MIFRAFVIVVFGFLSLAFPNRANAQYSEGACGGSYRGQDGAGYPCGTNRRPVCQQGTGRCQCLERRACGGKQDEDW